MIEDYSGIEGEPVLRDALASNRLLDGDGALVGELLSRIELHELAEGEVVIDNNKRERDLFLVIAGSLSVEVEGVSIADVWAGEYVGEMALIDRNTLRSANVVAGEESVVARISEPEFTALADQHPRLWRNLAIDLVRRLTDR